MIEKKVENKFKTINFCGRSVSDRRKRLCAEKGVRGGGKEGRREVKGMGERDNELLESQHGGGRGRGLDTVARGAVWAAG